MESAAGGEGKTNPSPSSFLGSRWPIKTFLTHCLEDIAIAPRSVLQAHALHLHAMSAMVLLRNQIQADGFPPAGLDQRMIILPG